MKVILLCFAIVAAASSAVVVSTVDDLLAAQNELTIGHEFSETLLQINRNILSSYIAIVTTQLVDSFMDSYAELHIIADDTTAEFNALTVNACVSIVRDRWDIQIHRYGQKLSECLLGSVAEVNVWNDYVNTIHHTAQATTNQVQNAGIAELGDRDTFTGRDSLGGHINIRFRNLLSAARPYLDRFEEFRAGVVDEEEEIIEQLTQCDRALAAAFAIEANDDLARARNCA